MSGMLIFLGIFAVPVFIGGYLVWKMKRSFAEERAWAEAELKKASPDPRAYGSFGAALLNEKRAKEALPLLEKAAALEARQGGSVRALILLVEAEIEAAGREKALASLARLRKSAAGLPQGRQAAAFHAAGKLYKHLGLRPESRECLKKAVELQPDDWVDEGGGHRYKRRGVASIYAKDLAAAELN